MENQRLQGRRGALLTAAFAAALASVLFLAGCAGR